MRKTIAEIYRDLINTQEGGYDFLSVGVIAKLIECSCGIPCLHLRKYTPYPTHVVDWGVLVFYADGTFEEGLVCIMDSRE